MVGASGKKSSVKRIRLRYHGRVQGVGFRFTVCRVAGRLKISGMVRNEPDGTVLVDAEGPYEDLMEMQQEISRSHVGRYITDTEIDRLEPENHFHGFDIAY